MSLHCRKRVSAALTALLPALALICLGNSAYARDIRVCADPDNMPFSHRSGAGLENKLMELIGRELGFNVKFVWKPQWRGFTRKTLRARLCDVIPGMPVDSERARTTRPYYTSTYAFVTPKSRSAIRSFNDLRRGMRIGVQLIGDDGVNSPPVEELASRGYTSELKGYMAWGKTYGEGAPLEQIVTAVSKGHVDVAIVWGPVAGYFSTRQAAPLQVEPVSEREKTIVPMTFAIGMGVRRGDQELAQRLDRAIAENGKEIDALVKSYGISQAAKTVRSKVKADRSRAHDLSVQHHP